MSTCIKCGCTDARACPGGCSWVSLNPPICSACDDDDGGDETEPFIECAHQPLWTSPTEGYCVRCHLTLTPGDVDGLFT